MDEERLAAMLQTAVASKADAAKRRAAALAARDAALTRIDENLQRIAGMQESQIRLEAKAQERQCAMAAGGQEQGADGSGQSRLDAEYAETEKGSALGYPLLPGRRPRRPENESGTRAAEPGSLQSGLKALGAGGRGRPESGA